MLPRTFKIPLMLHCWLHWNRSQRKQVFWCQMPLEMYQKLTKVLSHKWSTSKHTPIFEDHYEYFLLPSLPASIKQFCLDRLYVCTYAKPVSDRLFSSDGLHGTSWRSKVSLLGSSSSGSHRELDPGNQIWFFLKTIPGCYRVM